MKGRTAGVAVLVAVSASCMPSSDSPVVSNARIGQPAGANGALYMTVGPYGTADRLISADTGVASSIEMHESVVAGDGTVSMRLLSALDLPARSSLVLEPGGFHLMLIEVDRLQVGATVSVRLVWEHAGEMMIEAAVVDPSEVIDDEEDHDH